MALVQRNTSKVAPTEYTPVSERGKDDPTSFLLAPLDGIQRLEVLQHTYVDPTDGELKLNHEGVKRALKYSIKGATNLVDEKGNAAELCITDLEPGIMVELANRIIHISTISDEERKN